MWYVVGCWFILTCAGVSKGTNPVLSGILAAGIMLMLLPFVLVAWFVFSV